MGKVKTNAMRILENNKIEYEEIEYDLGGEFKSAVDAGKKSHVDLNIMYKTIATISKENEIIIYLLRSYDSIDMKKAAKVAGVKSISILPTKNLKAKVGYQRGETTPLAMKKDYPVFIDDSAKDLDKMIVSGGKCGVSLKHKTMIIKIFKNKKIYQYNAKDVFELDNKLKIKDFSKLEKTSEEEKIIINFKNDKENESLKLLVILSPIFITIFDNSTSLDFFKKNLEKSNFEYGLYPNFFENFSKKNYFEFYKSHDKIEDIILKEDESIDFKINYLENKYLLALVAMIEVIFSKYNRKNLIRYFKEIRNDIVINGRRSILANDIYAFYLSKYLVNWALDLMKIARYKDKNRYLYIDEIYKLTNNLKRPIKKDSLE